MRGRISVLAVVVGLFVGPIGYAYAAITLESDSEIASAGYFRLQWEASETPLKLVESLDPEFKTLVVVYQGPDTARLVSGKSDGVYYYRLEDATGSRAEVASNTLQVTVQHHSLARALTFFSVGAAVFAATLALVLLGGRNERHQ